jgi:hypothetical protein
MEVTFLPAEVDIFLEPVDECPAGVRFMIMPSWRTVSAS